VTRADAPRLLEYGGIHGNSRPLAAARLTLWHGIDRRVISWGAAGWHICFDVLDRLLAGKPIGAIAAVNAMKLKGWERSVGEYAKQFGTETPNGPPKAAQRS
jgi:hypothetical protein